MGHGDLTPTVPNDKGPHPMPDVYTTISSADPAVVAALADILELRAADPQQREMREAYLSDVVFPPGARVVEIGCGPGPVARSLAARPGVAEAVGVFDGDYATTTVAGCAADPLQACVQACVENLVHDPWLARRLAALLRDAGFEHVRLRGHSYIEAPSSAGYLLSIIDRGADALLSTGRVGPAWPRRSRLKLVAAATLGSSSATSPMSAPSPAMTAPGAEPKSNVYGGVPIRPKAGLI